jgi:formylglycine-generating enzyme required for sulfatase activity
MMTADFVIPANQTATILLVSTPYYYWYSGSRGSGAQTHLLQFLQWNVFGIREMLGDVLEWTQLLGGNL